MDKLNDESKIKKDVMKYLNTHIQCSASSSKAIWHLMDIQSDAEAVWITLHTPFTLPEDHQFDIRNTILLQAYNDQKNITHITWNTVTQSVVFEHGSEQKIISF